MRTAVVGLGWWGCELAAAATRTADTVVVARGCSPVEAERESFSTRFGVPAYATLNEVLGDNSLEAVILATPHSLHAVQAIAAARAGKHVFVEKPLALTTADAIAVVTACAKAGVTLAVGHNRRLLPQLALLKSLIADGACGSLLHVEANFSTAEALTLPAGHWRTSRTECPGGAMTVLGVHVIDWLHVLFGPMAHASASFARRAVTTGMDDTASAHLTFASGLTASLVTLYAAPYRNTLVVHGSEAAIDLSAAAPETADARPTLTLTRRDGTRQALALPYVDTLAQQLVHWSQACKGRGDVAVSGIEAARNIAALEAIVGSAAAGGVPVAAHYAGLW